MIEGKTVSNESLICSPYDHSPHQVLSNGTLIIRNTVITDQMLYTCMASNVGGVTSATVSLAVLCTLR